MKYRTYATIALLVLTQGSHALAQANPLEGIYSDDWHREFLKEETRFSKFGGSGDDVPWATFGCFLVGSFGGGALGRKFAPALAGSNTAWIRSISLGLATGAGCGWAVWNNQRSRRIEDKHSDFRARPLDVRMIDKLRTDLLSRLAIAERTEKTGPFPIQERVFTRGEPEVRQDISRLIEILESKSWTMDDALNSYSYLLETSDRQLIRAIYAVRRQEAAGLPLSSINAQSIKRLSAAPVTNPGAPDASTAGAAQ